jgi:phosphatidate cytidylyltransferase
MLALAVLLAGLWEFYRMTQSDAPPAAILLGIALGALILAAAYLDSGMAAAGRYVLLPGACALSFATVYWYNMSRHSANLPDAALRSMTQLCGIMYIPFLGAYLILLRGRPDGITMVFLVLFTAWAGDTAAFAIGSWIGRHRLSRRISPKKTVEGAVASLAGGILVTVLFKLICLPGLTLAHCLILGAGLNIMNQFGDLCESFIKRAASVKDSGTLFPGHGGVLDRIDSLLFAAPFLFYYMNSVLPV